MYHVYILKLTSQYKHLESACVFSFQWKDSVVTQSYFYRKTENKNSYQTEILNTGEALYFILMLFSCQRKRF